MLLQQFYPITSRERLCYGLEDRASIPCGDRELFSSSPRRDRQPPIQRAPGALSSWVKQPGT